MYSPDLSRRRNSLPGTSPSAAWITVLTLVAMSLGCTEPTSPGGRPPQLEPSFDAATTFSLSAELRGMRARGEKPSLAKGVLQLRLTQSIGDPSIFVAAWLGSVQNPKQETFVRGSIGFIGDPNVLPADLQAELAGIALIGDPNLANRFTFSGERSLSARLATLMVGDPDEFVVTLYTAEHPNGAIAGVFMGDGSV